MKIAYIGAHPVVDVDEAGVTVLQDVPKGEPIDVPVELAERLLAQDVWHALDDGPVPTPAELEAKRIEAEAQAEAERLRAVADAADDEAARLEAEALNRSAVPPATTTSKGA